MRVGRYEIIDEIGAGGMGRVRLARDPSGRIVVLKTALRDDIDDDERLRDEARVGQRVRHPSLVETLDLFEIDDDKAGRNRPVLVTAYVPGVTLIELRRVGPMNPVVVCRLGRQLAEALDAIHDAKDLEGRPLDVLHRDVTAGNCLIGHDGRARLIDLGISRSAESRALRTETGLLRGTLRYLGPELFDGGHYSAQSDLWALGVVLWEALLGRAAVTGSDAVAVGRICSGNLMTLDEGEDAEPRVSRAIAQLLRRNAVDRPRRAREAAALFAMLEKALPGDADELAQALVWRAIGGPEVEGETSVVAQATRNFGGHDDVTAPPQLAAALALTVADHPLRAAINGAPPSQDKTPSQGIAHYAAFLQSMEKSLTAAWHSADARVSASVAHLPTRSSSGDQERTEALAPMTPGRASTNDDVGTSDGQLAAPSPAPAFFAERLPLPPRSQVEVLSSPPPLPADHDDLSTPLHRPALEPPPTAPVPSAGRRAAVLGLVALLLVALAAAVVELGGFLPSG